MSKEKDVKWLGRTEALIGPDGIEILQNAHVLIVGLGGVGSFAAEFICRAGIGKMTIVDGDVVDPTNRNRQLPALATNHGQPKAEYMAERLKSINPDLELTVIQSFLTPDKFEEILSEPFDFVLDCIDSITPKLLLLATAYEKNLRIVSSMGAGGKMDPTQIRITDLFETYQCGFAQYIRKRIKKLGVGKGITAVYSIEETDRNSLLMTDGSNFKRSAYGTISYLPAAFGGAVASVAIRSLLNLEIDKVGRPKNLPKTKLQKKS